jgi:ABC-type taurine transport system substrate-binding protein
MYNITLQGDPMYASTKGYQTIWVAGYGTGAFDFGSGVTLNQAAQAADTTGDGVQLTVAGDPRNSFAAGDQLIGSTGGPKMEVVSVDSGTLITVKNITEQIDNTEELVVRNPLKFRIGLEY